MTLQDNTDPDTVAMLDATLVKHSQRDRTCMFKGCGKAIPKGFAYYRHVYKADGKFACDDICLDCWKSVYTDPALEPTQK